MDISGVAMSMADTVASDIGLAFELAIKALAQGLSPNPDGTPQVLNTHEQRAHLWNAIPEPVRSAIDKETENVVCRRYGWDNSGKVLPFDEYLEKHKEFIDATVPNRYAMSGNERWKSDHGFLAGKMAGLGHFHVTTYKGKTIVDGLGVLVSYWWAIMTKALKLRWPDDECEKDEKHREDRDEIEVLINRSIWQILGHLSVMSDGELQTRRFDNWTKAKEKEAANH